jgi:uncharacterized protein (TIGR03435 family)
MFSGGIAVVVAAAALGSAVLQAQNGAGTQSAKMMAKDAHPVFDVATIKASDPNSRTGAGLGAEGRHISYTNQTVKDLILLAYGIQEKQLVDAPAWLGTEKYDIDGVPDIEGTPNLRQMQEMFRKLLADRFNLKLHWDKRDLAVYALRLGKGGPKIAGSQGDPNGLPHQNMRPTPQLVTLKVTNASMADFMLEMQEVLDKPIVDQTGLTGKFDFTLQWTPDESQLSAMGMHVSPPADSPNAQPGLFTAIQEQLGLKLDAVKAPADVLVMDKVERPSAN